MSSDQSFQLLMERLQAHDEEAARRLFEAYAHRLVGLAQERLDKLLWRRVDPEDVVQSVFKSFFKRQAQGQWHLGDWEGLWALLASITVHKCARRRRESQAARRDIRRDVAVNADLGDSAPGWDVPSPEPTPEEAASLVELVESLLADLEERERRIVLLSLQGEAIARIAELADCSERKVYRVQERLRAHLEGMRDAGEGADR